MAENFQESVIPGSNFDMLFVQGGEFEMGDDENDVYANKQTIHKVKLDAFYIGKFPVTQGLWESVMDTNPSFFKGGDPPVEQVSWEDCQEFIQKLNIQTGKIYRLPTEAEWEYTAKGGVKSQGYAYAGNDKLKEVGWYKDNSHEETKDVGQKMPNELGLYDMTGNVWEWCQDWFDSGYYQECADSEVTVNPQGPDKGSDRVFRGGSWFNAPRYCRVAYRISWRPGARGRNLGFRLALSLQ